MKHRWGAYENQLILIALLLQGCLLFDRYVILFLLPSLVHEFGLAQVAVGGVLAAQALGSGLAGWVFGSLSDRIGRRAVLIPGAILFSLLSAASGLVGSFVQLIGVRFFMTATEGATEVPLMATIGTESSERRRGLNQGLIGASGTLMAFVIGPVVATQLAANFGWRWTFVLVGLPSLLVALLVWRFVREPHRQRATDISTADSWHRFREVVRDRNIKLSLLTAMLFGLYVASAGSFIPLFLTTSWYHLETTTMGTVVGAAGLGSLVGAILLPWISDRLGRKPVLALGFGLVTLGTWVLPVIGPDPTRLSVVLTLMNLGLGVSTLTLFLVPMESTPLALTATAAALPLLGLELVGAVGPIAAGAGADAFGGAFPLWLGGTATLLAALTIPFFTETAPSRRQAPRDDGLAVAAA